MTKQEYFEIRELLQAKEHKDGRLKYMKGMGAVMDVVRGQYEMSCQLAQRDGRNPGHLSLSEYDEMQDKLTVVKENKNHPAYRFENAQHRRIIEEAVSDAKDILRAYFMQLYKS